jgi:hypothetical protein
VQVSLLLLKYQLLGITTLQDSEGSNHEFTFTPRERRRRRRRRSDFCFISQFVKKKS